MTRLKTLFVTLCVAFAANAHADAPPSLDNLLGTLPVSVDGAPEALARINAFKETGMAYGAQAGLAHKLQEVNARLERRAPALDQTYNFQALMMGGNIVPPVILEAKDVYEQSSDTVLRIIDHTYQIEARARFSYTPPTWRSYLIQPVVFDGAPVANVTPRDDKELALWKNAVAEGYRMGEAQGEEILKANFDRLQHDFNGMVLYRELLAKGKVTAPYAAVSHQSVTGQAGSHMHENEYLLTISVTPEFVMDKKQWPENKAITLAEVKSRISERLKQASAPTADVTGEALAEVAKAAPTDLTKGAKK